MNDSFESEPEIREALQYVERAISGIHTLHLGPLDYNVSTTIDDLRTAAAIVEQFGQNRTSGVSLT